MPFLRTQIYFNEFDYFTVDTAINIMTQNECQNDAKNVTIMFLKYHYLALNGKGSLEADNEKCWSLVKLLCIYFYHFILLNHNQPVLNNIFFQNLCVTGKMSIG